MSIWYARHPDLVRVCVSNDFIVDYDKSRGMYRVSFFEGYHYKDEICFDAYEDKEINEAYIVYGHIKDTNDTWVENIFIDREQALAFAEYMNITEKNDGWYYYASNSWSPCKSDYVEELKKLKEGI